METTERSLLIVDDEAAIVFAYKDILSAPQVSVDTAQSVDEARNLLADGRYKGAIVDLRLCGSNGNEGFDVVAMIRSACPECRIIMMTAFGQPEIRQGAFVRGVDCFFEKPVSPEIIRSTFKSYGVL